MFRGKSVVFTGAMRWYTRRQAQAIVKRVGGLTPSSVTMKLDYLVVGGDGSDKYLEGYKGTKILKAEKYNREKGSNISIITEQDFRMMVE